MNRKSRVGTDTFTFNAILQLQFLNWKNSLSCIFVSSVCRGVWGDDQLSNDHEYYSWSSSHFYRELPIWLFCKYISCYTISSSSSSVSSSWFYCMCFSFFLCCFYFQEEDKLQSNNCKIPEPLEYRIFIAFMYRNWIFKLMLLLSWNKSSRYLYNSNWISLFLAIYLYCFSPEVFIKPINNNLSLKLNTPIFIVCI